MNAHATAQLIGARSHQCDATATYTHQGTRAYVLLDGIGSTDKVRTWTRTTARRLARMAARNGAETGLRTVHAMAAADTQRQIDGNPLMADPSSAVAVVAVAAPGQPLDIAWCGDSRAYHLPAPGELRRLTNRDHNVRAMILERGGTPRPSTRNMVTSHLGSTEADPEIGTATTASPGRLLLVSDGAYEPLEDLGLSVADYLDGTPTRAARTLTTTAVAHGGGRADNATALVADLS